MGKQILESKGVPYRNTYLNHKTKIVKGYNHGRGTEYKTVIPNHW